METPLDIDLIETYRGVPIVGLSYPEPTLLNVEVHMAQARRLLELPHSRFAVVLSYRNLSVCSSYGDKEQALTWKTPLFQELRERVVTIVRYHAGSLTSLIQTMSAHTLAREASNFAPDRDSAIRGAQRAIEQVEAAEKNSETAPEHQA